VLSAVAGGLSVALAYRLLLQVFDRRVAVLVTLVAPVVVEFAVYSHRAATDVPFMLLALASMSASLLAGGSLRRHGTAGALAAVAFLTRYNGFFLVAGAALMLAVADPARLGRRQRTRAFAVYAAAFVLVCTPWFVATWKETGRWLESRNLETVVATFYTGARWQDDPAVQAGDLRTLVGRDPVRFAMQYARNLADHFSKNLSVLLGWPLALVPIAGILGLAIRPPTRRQTALYLFAAAYCLVTGVVFYAPRFFLPLILPLLAIGFALVRAPRERAPASSPRWRPWLQSRASGQVAFLVALACVLAAGVVQVRRVVAAERTIQARRPLYLLDAARVIARDASGSRPHVMARKGHVAYYAGGDFTPYSTQIGSLEELVQTARARHAQYIVYSKLEYSMLPRMLFMAVLDTVPSLQEIHRAQSVRVFRVPPDGPATLSDAQRYDLLLANLRAARLQRRPSAIYIACEDLGRHHLDRREFAAAAARFESALDVAQGSAREPGMAAAAAAARQVLAVAYLGAGRAADAIAPLQENLTYYQRLQAAAALARTHATLAQAYEALGRDEDARRERTMARE